MYYGGLRTFPVFLAVLEKTGIIGAVLDVLPEKLSLRLLPGLGRHSQTVEADRRSSKIFWTEISIYPRKRAYSSAVRAGDS